jgi:hypothetical protein
MGAADIVGTGAQTESAGARTERRDELKVETKAIVAARRGADGSGVNCR